MDERTLQIARLLLKNCRITYREIAEILNLSVNAVYKRVQNMIEEGLIRAFTAQPSLIALNGLEILIFGRTQAQNLDSLAITLGELSSTYFVGLAAGNIIYVGAYLQNISQLHEYTSQTTKLGKFEDFTSCIKQTAYRESEVKLTSLDYEILRALKDEARRSVSDFADEVGVSAKTARKRIKRMEKYNLVEFSINFAPQAITSHFHIYLYTEDDYHVEFKRLESKYSANLLYLQKFSNIPNLIMMTALTSTNEEAAKLHMQLQDEEFERLEHNIFFNGYFFETWRDKLYIEKLTN